MVARYWSVNVNARFFVYLAWFDEGRPRDYRAVSVEFLERIEQGVGRRVPRLMCCRMRELEGNSRIAGSVDVREARLQEVVGVYDLAGTDAHFL